MGGTVEGGTVINLRSAQVEMEKIEESCLCSCVMWVGVVALDL